MYVSPRSRIIINTSSLAFTINANGTTGDTSFMRIMKNKQPAGEQQEDGCEMTGNTITCKTIDELEETCGADNKMCVGGALANLTGQIKEAIRNIGERANFGLLGNGSCDKRDVTIIDSKGKSVKVIGYDEGKMPGTRDPGGDCYVAPRPAVRLELPESGGIVPTTQ